MSQKTLVSSDFFIQRFKDVILASFIWKQKFYFVF